MNKFKTLIVPLLLTANFLLVANCSKAKKDKDTAVTSEKLPQLPDAPPVIKCADNKFTSETFNLGRINSQFGWESAAGEAFDEEIENIGSQACRGQGVWRISNSYASGGFGNQPRSPAFTKSSGESTLRSPGGGDSMYYEFFFRTKSVVSDSSAMDVSFASSPSIDRLDLIRISNASDLSKGLQILMRDGVNLNVHEVAINLTRGVWHHLKVVVQTPDGFNNDVLKIYVNGILAGTYTTWENWRQAQPASNLAFSRVLFRIPATIHVPTAEGFYLDDFQQVTFDSSAPTVPIESYRTGFEN